MTLFFIRGGAVMRITIAGGGNIGTQFAVPTAEKGHEVTIFTSNPGLFRERLSIVDKSGNTIHEGNIHLLWKAYLIFPAYDFRDSWR